MPKYEPHDVDRPQLDDPDIDIMDLLAVAEEARHSAVTKRNAAADAVRMYAIIAITRGKPPREVALAAGYNFNGPKGPLYADSPFGRIIIEADALPPGMQLPDHSETTMDNFARWLCDYLYKHITGHDA